MSCSVLEEMRTTIQNSVGDPGELVLLPLLAEKKSGRLLFFHEPTGEKRTSQAKRFLQKAKGTREPVQFNKIAVVLKGKRARHHQCMTVSQSPWLLLLPISPSSVENSCSSASDFVLAFTPMKRINRYKWHRHALNTLQHTYILYKITSIHFH